MADKFQPGDTVRLKSGGPTLTAACRVPSQHGAPVAEAYTCLWATEGTEQIFEKIIPADCLEKAAPAP